MEIDCLKASCPNNTKLRGSSTESDSLVNDQSLSEISENERSESSRDID